MSEGGTPNLELDDEQVDILVTELRDTSELLEKARVILESKGEEIPKIMAGKMALKFIETHGLAVESEIRLTQLIASLAEGVQNSGVALNAEDAAWAAEMGKVQGALDGGGTPSGLSKYLA